MALGTCSPNLEKAEARALEFPSRLQATLVSQGESAMDLGVHRSMSELLRHSTEALVITFCGFGQGL